MGRIVDLCGEIAAAAEDGPDGVVLPTEDYERLSGEFTEDEIEDGLSLVNESLMQSELVEAADSLSERLVDLLGQFGDEKAFTIASAGGAHIGLEEIAHLVRRVARLEEVLGVFRDRNPPDRHGFDALQKRLAIYGIEDEMQEERHDRDDDDEAEDES